MSGALLRDVIGSTADFRYSMEKDPLWPQVTNGPGFS